MEERIYTLKKGTEVPDQFDGVTVPFKVPASNEEMLSLAGDKAYIVFNEAYALRVQKDAKEAAQDEGATVASIRQAAVDYKIGTPRTRKPAGPPKTQSQIKRAAEKDLLADMLADPEIKARYEAKMAALKAAAATSGNGNGGSQAGQTPPADTSTPQAGAAKPGRQTAGTRK